jgi:hypothetical protein
MNSRLPAFTLLIVAGALVASAAPVHLRFTNSTGGLAFNADSASVPWNPAGGHLTELNFYYDAAHPGPGSNYWSVRVDSELGGFTIKRPFTTLYLLDPTSLSFEYYSFAPGIFEEFNFSASFAAPLDLSGSLPPRQPVLAAPVFGGPVFWQIDGGSSFFPVPHMGEGFGAGGFQTVVATPEPATYAIGGLMLLAGAVWLRCRPLGAAGGGGGAG